MKVSRRQAGARLKDEEKLAEIRRIVCPELRCADCDRVGQCDQHFPLLLALAGLIDPPTQSKVDAVLHLPSGLEAV